MKSIKEQLREGLLTEDYNLVSELKSLSQEILTYFANSWLREGRFYSDEIYLKNFINPKNYEMLGELIQESRLGVEMVPNYSSNGSFYRTHKRSTIYSIKIRVTDNQIDGINKEIKAYDGDNLSSFIYWSTYDFNSVMIHELQHAYDSFRSDGRFDTHKQNDAFHRKTIETMFNRDKKTRQAMFDRYLKLTHEINARFSQAIEAINPFDLVQVGDDWERKVLSWDEYYKEFVKKFMGWDVMSPNNRKRLTTRLAKTYQQFLDKQKE